eukprot:NODE_26_length_40862_cov_0.679513.p13 type:complete len:373 gc:universal NODE_26_length_40862_cov_0.679513:26645-25527(-)
MKKSSLKVSPHNSVASKPIVDPKKVALTDALEFMQETWGSLYKRSSMVDKKSLDIQMLAFSISAVLQKTQSFIKTHHSAIPKNMIPKLKETLQQIKTMIEGLLLATKTEFRSHNDLMDFIHNNYVTVQEFSVKIHEYLLNEKIQLPEPIKIDRPTMISFISSKSPSDFAAPSDRSSTNSNHSVGISPLPERSMPATEKRVVLLDDSLLDKFICNEVLKCYHYLIQKIPTAKKHLPLLDLSGIADEQDEQILSHFLTDLCDGVIFCRLYNLIAEKKKIAFIEKVYKPEEWFDRMEHIRKVQKHYFQNGWDIYCVKTTAIDAMAISRKTVKGNKHVCALFIKFVHLIGKELNVNSWEDNLGRWLDYTNSCLNKI